ncbi:MAG: TerB family tellurite resistance protein [Pararhodobacter sp.]
MIDALKALFRPQAAPRDEVPADTAVAALLVDAAHADEHYTPEDRQGVIALLQAMFELDPREAETLCAAGEAEQKRAADIVRFTRVVKFGLEEPERLRLMEALWEIVLVDHVRNPHEDALLRRLAPLLAVSDHDSAAARQRVLARQAAG